MDAGSKDSDGGGDSNSPPDSGDPPISGIIVLVIVVILVFLCCCGKLRRNKERRDDEEELEPSEETSGWSLFFCCSEGGTSSASEDRGNQQQQLSPIRTIGSLTNNVEVNVPVAPAEKTEAENVKQALTHLQISIQTESKEESAKTIRLAQNLILTRSVTPTENSLQTCLIIGVDARPTALAGYCVNLREMNMEYYVIKMEDFPWLVEDSDDPDEFEMKNLQFALSLWGKSIRKYKTFRVYTDNFAINQEENEFGVDAMELLDHFTECEDARKQNEQEHVNRKQKLTQFAVYIQPADDFSRWEIERGIDFLSKYYGIDRKHVHGTHKLVRQETANSRAWYDPSGNYNHYIQRAKAFATNFRCENCFISTFLEIQMTPTRGRDATSISQARSRSQSQPRGRAADQENQGNNKRRRRKRHKSQPQQNTGIRKFWFRK